MPTPTSPDLPLSYTVPPFPSLYWPINTPAGSSYYLYYQTDIWRFTLYWTLITYGAVHLATSGWAVIVWVRHVLGVEETPGGYVGTVKAFGEALGKGYSHTHSHSRGDESIEMRDRSAAGTAPRRTSATQDRRESAVTSGSGSTRSRSHERARPTKQNRSKRSKAKSLKWVWVIPVVYCTIGSIEALVAGSIVGVV